MSPRHKHTFDQLRYFIEGDAKYGTTTYHPGDCVYFPEGVAYGPQTGIADVDSIQIVLQWSGPSGIYYPADAEQREAKRALEARGEFRDGVYYPTGGKPRDGFEAILEQITGEPVVYASARYDAPIRMRTAAFAAVADPGDPKVVRRRLARFNECGPDIAVIEIAPGGVLQPERAPADRLYTLISGDGRYGTTPVEGISCMHVRAGDASETLAAHAPCTVLAVTFG
jgi:quercetin dioxygenase-like cupin family protein